MLSPGEHDSRRFIYIEQSIFLGIMAPDVRPAQVGTNFCPFRFAVVSGYVYTCTFSHTALETARRSTQKHNE